MYRDTILLLPYSADTSSKFPLTAYRQLADFRFAIRRFFYFSEQIARQHGLEPQQHQLLLAIKGLPPETRPTIQALSDRLCQRHHSTVELVNRMAERDLVVRKHSEQDKREVLVALTRSGEDILRQLSILHWQELQREAPALSSVLQEIVTGKRDDD